MQDDLMYKISSAAALCCSELSFLYMDLHFHSKHTYGCEYKYTLEEKKKNDVKEIPSQEKS